MKHKADRYLSHRVLILVTLLQLLLFLSLLWMWWQCMGTNRHYAVPAVATALLGAIFLCFYRWIWLPYKETERMLELFSTGYTLEGIMDMDCVPTPGTKEALGRIQALLSTDQLISASKRQAQYLALQNQINPHFLYNTLDGIRSDALIAGLDNVAKMTEALSTFFRYTISNLEHLVSLEEELSNVESYFIIQQYRFGERMSLSVHFDSDEDRRLLLRSKMPKLALQPIVENAIIHGIEGKVGNSSVRIKIQATTQRMIIVISDDGLGMPQETLDKLNHKLKTTFYDYIKPENENKGGIALVNVNNRIRLLFGESFGISVYSTPGLGTDVEMTLPFDPKVQMESEMAP